LSLANSIINGHRRSSVRRRRRWWCTCERFRSSVVSQVCAHASSCCRYCRRVCYLKAVTCRLSGSPDR